jgi:hypothetical protein
LLRQVWGWGQTLDEGTVRVLESIYQLAPDAVAVTLGGGSPELLMADAGVSFADHLRGQLAASQPLAEHASVPSYDIVVTAAPTPAAWGVKDATVQWQWANRGRSLDEPLTAKLLLLDAEGRIEKEVESEYSDPGAGRRDELTLRDIPDGHWWLRLFAPYTLGMENSPGADANTIEYVVGDRGANLDSGAADPADGFLAASERFAAAAAAAGQDDRDTQGAELAAALGNIQRSVRSLGMPDPGLPVPEFGSTNPMQVSQFLAGLGVAIERVAQVVPATVEAGNKVGDTDEWQAFVRAYDDRSGMFSRPVDQGVPAPAVFAPGERVRWVGGSGVVDRVEGTTVYVVSSDGQQHELEDTELQSVDV